MPAVVGLTGSFGTGKSTVARMFAHKGARVLDADDIAHQALSLKEPSGRRVVKVFGKDIVRRGRISRSRLAHIVFTDPAKRRALEKIIHPVVLRKIWAKARAAGKKRIVILNVPLLIEAGMHWDVDSTILVTADRKTQFKRLRERGVSLADIRRRIKTQMPLSRKKKYADFVINNNGSYRKTLQQVERVWQQLGGKNK